MSGRTEEESYEKWHSLVISISALNAGIYPEEKKTKAEKVFRLKIDSIF